MKLKYFLRGLGSGVVVTALILSIAPGGDKETMSDQEIIKRAEQLGMVQQERDLLAEATKSPTITNEATPMVTGEATDKNFTDDILAMATEVAKPSKEAEPTKEVTPTEDAKSEEVTPTKDAKSEEVTPTKEAVPTKAEATVTPTKEPTATPEPDKDATVTPAAGEKKVITIVSGMWSDQVARELQAMGVVESATDFDQYLIKNGYANRIVVGTFQIPEHASYEEIAKIITNR